MALSTTLTAPADPRNGALDAPPPNLAPTSVHLAAILAQHSAAIGKPTGADTSIEDWRFTDTGMIGAEHLERSGSNYHSKIVRGPFVEEYGQDNGQRWNRDYDGFVSPTTALDDESFFAERVEEDAADPKNDVSVVGVTQDAKPAYVVRVMVDGEQHPEWVFYDVSSGLVTRVERIILDKHRIITAFDDFRTTGGVTTAWHIHDTWDPRELDDDYVRTSLQRGVAVDAAQFAQPQSNPTNGYQDSAFTIPAQMFDDGSIVIRVTVGGRGLDMLLDTAVGEDIIDEDVARQMNLSTFGQHDRAEGQDLSFETLLPTATIGPMTLSNLAFLAERFDYKWSYSTEVVGVLGYDFLSGLVLKIDYANRKIQVLPASQFDAAEPVPGGASYPIDFDSGLPFTQLYVSGVLTSNVVLTNAMFDTEFFGSFVADHPDAFASSGGTHDQRDLPFANNESFGQHVEEWQAEPTDVRFGLIDWQKPPLTATNYPLQLSEDRSVDAALGVDFLRFYDIYLDYPHGRLIVKPNALFYKTFHIAK